MQTIKLKIEDLGSSGEGIAHSVGKTFFVPFALPGEEVEAEIEKENGNLVFARLKKILKQSSERTSCPCPYFMQCGGCDLQHMKYENQLLFKQNMVKNLVKKIAAIDAKVLPCTPSEKNFEYRNKISLPVKNGKLGLFEKASHNIVEIKECLITEKFNKNLIGILQNFLAKFKNENITHFVARFLCETLLLTIVSKTKEIFGIDFLKNEIQKNFKDFGINININKKENAETLSNVFVHVCGKEQIIALDKNFEISISNKSFFQVNNSVRNEIYNYVNTLVEGETIIDAYSGTCVLSCMLSKSAKKVVAVEIEKSACNDAKQIIEKNKINNIQVICGDCREEIPNLCKKMKIDGIVLDPPRAGCDKKVLESIIGAKIPKIVYISCSPQSLARDLKILSAVYQIENVKPFDMFPQTHHVESVVHLKLK